MSQSGLRHAVTEPDHLDAKRERSRRGAAGRAAALRRAPSDSDCSAETASLSADSADRVRPTLPPIRIAKQRSRRRGSEWEVLEGLKDGQRFERRPEVFNGYLHKKRKWPLKGWHKRFFVVDGGILVYARSPTDVARGRLHGSVDVGLSVISAKARRRRIDIDADEFIYHLRAKTPDVFRTWLNVLKAHRLYRQHLLTFGARESAPKIHVPLDELPPTETSSLCSSSSTQTQSPVNSNEDFLRGLREPNSDFSSPVSPFHLSHQNPVLDWNPTLTDHSELMPVVFEPLEDENLLRPGLYNRSMCSMSCLEKIYRKELRELLCYQDTPGGSPIAERQLHSTELERNSFKCETNIETPIFDYNRDFKPLQISKKPEKPSIKFKLDRPIRPVFPVFSDLDEVPSKKEKKIRIQKPKVRSPFLKTEPTTTFFLFAHKKRSRHNSPNSQMKRSKKSTNLVKYRNCSTEPPLDKPMSIPMLLKKVKNSNKSETASGNELFRGGTSFDSKKLRINSEVQTTIDITTKEHKSLQDSMTASEYDRITEQLILSIFEAKKSQCNSFDNIECYVNQMVKELYEVKLNQSEAHPVKLLFRTLLEYWLMNSSSEYMRNATKQAKSVVTQSINRTKEENLSSVYIPNVSKETQIEESCEENREIVTQDYPKLNTKKITYSFVKERRVQELERLLKNTVYSIEEDCSSDKQITKKLLNSIPSCSSPTYGNLKAACNILKKSVDTCKCSEQSMVNNPSNPSLEYLKLQNLVDRLLSEKSKSPDSLKEILKAYLRILDASNSTLSSEDATFAKPQTFTCNVQSEFVQKKTSIGVETDKVVNLTAKNVKVNCQQVDSAQDSGQIYLKDLLDKVTALFSKHNDKNENKTSKDKHVQPDDTKSEGSFESTLKPHYLVKNLIRPSRDKDSLVVDLTKYDLEHVSMNNDSKQEGTVSITIKLKESAPSSGEPKQKNLNLNFSDASMTSPQLKTHDDSRHFTTKNYCQPKIDARVSFKNPYIHYNPNVEELKILNVSTSDATSKAFKTLYESDNSIDESHRNGSQKSLIMHAERGPGHMKKYSRSFVFRPRKKCIVTHKSFANKTKGPNSIDENFIILLLENLTMLSQCVPKFYKDISVFYLKLKRKHEKNTQKGLGLLGQIYSQTGTHDTRDRTIRQDDINTFTCRIDSLTVVNAEKGTNTDNSSLLQRIDQSVYVVAEIKDAETQFNEVTYNRTKPVANLAVSTSTCNFGTSFIENYCMFEHKETETSAGGLSTANWWFHKTTNNKPRTTLSVSTSSYNFDTNRKLVEDKGSETTGVWLAAPKWLRNVTKNNAFSTAFNSLFENENSCSNFRFVTDDDYERKAEVSNKQRHIEERQRNDMFDWNKRNTIEIDLRSVSNKKPSTEKVKSRTSGSPDSSNGRRGNCGVFQIVHEDDSVIVEKNNNRNVYNVYPIFHSAKFPLSMSGSLTESSADLGMQFSDDIKTIYRGSSVPSFVSGLVSPASPPVRAQAGFVAGTPGGRLANWIVESGGPLEVANRELGQAQLSVQQLQRLLDAIELSHSHHHDTDQVSVEGASPNVKKDRRKFGLRKKKSNSKCASVELGPSLHVDASNSHTALSALTAPPSPGGGASSVPNSSASLPIACAAARPQSLPGAEALGANVGGGPASLASLTPDQQLKEDFTILAKDLVTTLKGVVSTLVVERSKLRAAMDPEGGAGGGVVAALRTNLTSALQQNEELRTRLSRIHDASDIAEMSSVNNTDPVTRQFRPSLSYSSSCVSASEFFDAEEHEQQAMSERDILPSVEAGVIELDGDSSSEASLSSEEGEPSGNSSDNSDNAMLDGEPDRLTNNIPPGGSEPPWRRRTRLPSPRPTPGGPSLWNLLYKNIGKDLSQVSMPVTINEPLNMLQRLCEELEYCELLDLASECAQPLERCALIGAFAVSAYAATAHRAASKPFNPLLGETYECVRPDKGFRFLAEQVSHHPPISACHASSSRWIFWQEARIKTKFWGKSMEFQPAGRVHVTLLPSQQHYSWNKVTTCVHNLFGGQRWVDQYGDMHITCHGSGVSAKLTFLKASSWSSSRHEVRGVVTDSTTNSSLRLNGRWSEELRADNARLLWRPGALPPDHELYYGFTRFAMELNEMEPGLRSLLPDTDTRLRPDQRALEEGDVESAEQYKHSLEQAQRERRRERTHQPAWFRKAFEDGEETWVFTGEYWKAREEGFSSVSLPRIW